MSWRTVVVSKQSKLDFKMGYMVIRSPDVKRIFIDEIAVLVIENPAVSMTGCLLEALCKKKVRIIFCDGKRNPYGELVPYYGSYDCSRKIKEQFLWSDTSKGFVWKSIVKEKINNQSLHLKELGYNNEALLLEQYVAEVMPHDASNREGHAAKVYFNTLFGMEFKRGANDCVNSSLNYGYGILLSAFNRCITSMGFATQIGIHHDNVFNFFNLSSDLMEPFRPLVDRMVVTTNNSDFNKDTKYYLINVLNTQITINNSSQTVLNAIDIYSRSVINALQTGNPDLISNYSL